MEEVTNTIRLRVTTPDERVVLAQRGCYAENWDRVLVAEDFDTEQLRNVRFEGEVTIGSKSRIYDSTISNYIIGNNCLIDDVLRMKCRRASTFGEGVMVAAVNENEGRSIPIYRELTAQQAYLMTMMRNRPKMVERMMEMVGSLSESHRSTVGRVGDNSKVVGARFIREVLIEEGCVVEGASH